MPDRATSPLHRAIGATFVLVAAVVVTGVVPVVALRAAAGSASAAAAPHASAGDASRRVGDGPPRDRAAASDDGALSPGEAATGRDEGRRAGPAAVVRRRLAEGAAGTYVGEILLERDSALARWPSRLDEPLTVWVQPWAAVTGWDDAFAGRARDAFADWERTGIPVRFTFTDDSAAADVRLTWIDHFDEPISGKTLWTRDERWWITGASITLALHHQDGAPLDATAVRAIALHEVGHLLGLDHTSDVASVMTPRVRVRDLSDADRATVRLLYSLPPGRVR
ncbi:MAG TPA: matrixin family metalloprotease [Gemmatimonadaceae bacterium]|nr:matrixin family metalloprotease [Gemmatimonadaceae bacterium]